MSALVCQFLPKLLQAWLGGARALYFVCAFRLFFSCGCSRSYEGRFHWALRLHQREMPGVSLAQLRPLCVQSHAS